MTIRRTKEKSRMTESTRLTFDRRSDVDRRKAHKLEYILKGGIERRRYKDRRGQNERREDWIRVSEWSSVWRELFDPEHYLSA
jgi:hypothetical protein